jgi:hypothetical protein
MIDVKENTSRIARKMEAVIFLTARIRCSGESVLNILSISSNGCFIRFIDKLFP